MEYGMAAGLAYVHPYYKDLEASRERAQLAINLDANARAKTKALTDMFRFGKANNPYDHRKLNEMIEKGVAEVGRYTTENPDWDKDPAKFAYVTNKIRGWENNEYTINALKFDEQVQFMQEALQKDPTIAQRDAFQQTYEQMQNYINTGSIDGIETNRKPFMYNPIPGFANLNEVAQAVGSRFGGIVKKTDPKGFPGNWYDDLDPEELEIAAYQMYNEHKEEFDKTYAQSGHKDPLSYSRELVKTYVKRQAFQGYPQYSDEYLQSKAALSGSGQSGSADPTTNTWNNNIAAYKVGHSSPAVFKTMFTDNVPVLIQGRSGKWNNILGNRVVDYTGKHAMMKDSDGRDTRFVEVETKIPFNIAEDLGLANGNFWFDNNRSNINEEYYDIAQYETDATGQIKEGEKAFIRIKGWMPVNEKSGEIGQLYQDALKITAKNQTPIATLDATTGGRMIPLRAPNGNIVYSPDGRTFYADDNLSSDIIPFQTPEGKYVQYNFQTKQFEEYE